MYIWKKSQEYENKKKVRKFPNSCIFEGDMNIPGQHLNCFSAVLPATVKIF